MSETLNVELPETPRFDGDHFHHLAVLSGAVAEILDDLGKTLTIDEADHVQIALRDLVEYLSL